MLLSKFLQLTLHAVDDLSGGVADNFQRGAQLFQLFLRTPPGHIAEGISGSVQAKVLADSKCHALSLALHGLPVDLRAFVFRLTEVNIVELSVADLVNQSLEGLLFAQTLSDGNAFF